MTAIATLGPVGSLAWQAAQQYDPAAEVRFHSRVSDVIGAFTRREADMAIIPVYNTREGEIKEYLRVMEKLRDVYWVGNQVMPNHLSLGSLDDRHELKMLVGIGSDLRQCEEYIADNFPRIPLIITQDIAAAAEEIKRGNLLDRGIIDTEKSLAANGFTVRERELAPYNQTRFAVLAHTPAPASGYDATALLSAPLRDRVGLLFDILGEFTKRGLNLLDLRTETDIKTQKLQIYLETEGHIEDANLGAAVKNIEEQVIQEPGAIKILGSYPRVDMRKKRISSFGFIGSGDMSRWFADKLENEGYTCSLTGRTSSLRPEEMIPRVDVVVVCVPISATPETIRQYAPMLTDGQALILLAGEAENNIESALAHTGKGVEVMLVHNLWGPQVTSIKDKNAAVVRTHKSGVLCSEFESFLYKHGAAINHDTASQHDLLMGVGQKLPTLISIALATTLRENSIPGDDIDSHSTLTSLYGLLAMARIHTQNPRTYAEILATSGDGRKIVESFVDHFRSIMGLADDGDIEKICSLIEKNRSYFNDNFLDPKMKQSLVVDEILTKMTRS